MEVGKEGFEKAFAGETLLNIFEENHYFHLNFHSEE